MINLDYLLGGFGLFFLLFVFGVLSFVLNRKYLLSLLLSLEAIILSLFCIRAVIIRNIRLEPYYCLIILTFAACEAAVGLSVLVNIISSHGSNYVHSLNLNQC